MTKPMDLIEKGKEKVNREMWKLVALIALETGIWALSYWVVGRFFGAEKFIYDVLLIVFIFAVGVTIILRGNATRNRSLNTLGFVVFLVGVFVVIYKYEAFAVKISAFAALLVAFAAFASIEESRLLRRGGVEREGRDRKERLVDEVAKWLRELEDNALPKYSEMMLGAKEMANQIASSPKSLQKEWVERYSTDSSIVQERKVVGGIKEAEYYKKLTVGVSEELSRLIGMIENEMEQRKEMLLESLRYPIDLGRKEEKPRLIPELIRDTDKSLEGLGLSDRDIINIRLGRNANAIRASIRKGLDKVIEVKTSFIEVR